MTGPFADRLFRITFAAAGVYNLAFGLWAALWPLAFFQLFQIPLPRYPGIWACLGMVVGVYGLLYWHAAWKLETAWPLIAVGFLGKVLGPLGMVMSFSDDWPRRLGMICVFNDLIWWLPFGLFLIRGTWIARRLVPLAPWICVAAHVAALGVLAAFLSPGAVIESDVMARALHVDNHTTSWMVGWALWMVAAASLVGFYAWWGANISNSAALVENRLDPTKRAMMNDNSGRTTLAVIAVVITALGMVCDFAGESSLILRLTESASGAMATVTAWDATAILNIERQFTLLSAGAANGLYTIGGALLTMLTPNLPRWLQWAMWITWLAGAVMTIAAIIGNVPSMVISTAILFPLLLIWVAWLGARWRPA